LGKKLYCYRLWRAVGVILLTLVLTISSISAKTNFQIVPTLVISEEYSDNYLKTANNKQEEFITAYELGFSMSFLDLTKQVYLSYSPVYKDYKNLNDRNGLEHKVSADGEFKPTKYTNLEAHLNYDKSSDNFQGYAWQNDASITGTTQVEKNTQLTYGYDYSNRFDEQFRTGIYKEHALHTGKTDLTHVYGKKNLLKVTFLYELDDYKELDPDEYTSYEPAGYFSYWFTPKAGIDSNFSFNNKDFVDGFNDIKTYSGDIRYIHKISKTLDTYIKYRHSYSETQFYDHHILHPSVGVDWDIADDSGISLGLGALFNKWSNDNDDSIDPFLDLNAYKTFDFNKRASLTFTGSSGYSDSGKEAASLGYNIYYRAGYLLNYQLLKQLSTNVYGSYRLVEFYETLDARKDQILTLGAGLSWGPLKWLQFNLNYSFSDFSTNSIQRDDYTENQVFFSVNLIPETPIKPKQDLSSASFDKMIYDRER